MKAITTPEMAHSLFLSIWKNINTRESVMIYYLDDNYFVQSYELLFLGGNLYCATDNVVIIKEVIRNQVTTFAIAHNHPNGNCTPSEDDMNHSAELRKLCSMLRLNIAQFIVTEKDIFTLSFFDHV